MNCDKCGKPVAHNEDATILVAIAMDCPTFALNYPRHIRCSPSHAQYIVHPDFPEIVDNRPEFDKRLLPEKERKVKEEKVTQAWLGLRNAKEEWGNEL